ncbi:hypothetical protein Tco_0493036 [Tanacetum coccineum]
MSQDVMLTVMNSMSLNNDFVNMKMQKCDSCEKCLNLDAELSKSKQAYNDLLKNHSQLEKHCISLKVSMQLKQEVFQNDESYVNQNAVEIQEYFEINDLKAQLQDKDTTICKLKYTIKSLRKNTKEEKVNPDKCDLEPIDKELENSVANLLSENEQNEDLKAQIQDKVSVITSLKNDLRKLKGKEIVENVIHTPSVTTIAPGIFKLILVPLPPRLLQNRDVHIDYLRHTQEQANTLWELVEHAKAKQPLDRELDFASKSRKLGVKCSTSNCGSKPPGNKRNDRISQTPSRNKKNKVVQIVLWYLDSGCSKHMTRNRSQLMNFVSKFLGTVKFGNDQIARIMGYGDYQLGNIVISRVYYVEGLGHNLFYVGQFCDADLEVAFWKNTCFIRNLEGVDLLLGSRDTNLYTISLDGMLKSSLICLLSKASKTKSWLWHRRLSHLNFACALGKSKRSSHQPKAEDTNQEKLYLLHMDLCGPMRVASINGKSSKPELQYMTPATSSTGLVLKPVSQQPCIPPNRNDWDHLFQPMFDEYYNPLTIVVSPVQEVAAPRAEVLADSPVSTSIDQDAPSTKSPKTPTFHDDPLNASPQKDSTSQGSSSNVRQIYTPFEHFGRCTKDHPIANVIGDPSRSVSTQKQLETDAM